MNVILCSYEGEMTARRNRASIVSHDPEGDELDFIAPQETRTQT